MLMSARVSVVWSLVPSSRADGPDEALSGLHWRKKPLSPPVNALESRASVFCPVAVAGTGLGMQIPLPLGHYGVCVPPTHGSCLLQFWLSPHIPRFEQNCLRDVGAGEAGGLLGLGYIYACWLLQNRCYLLEESVNHCPRARGCAPNPPKQRPFVPKPTHPGPREQRPDT